MKKECGTDAFINLVSNLANLDNGCEEDDKKAKIGLVDG